MLLVQKGTKTIQKRSKTNTNIRYVLERPRKNWTKLMKQSPVNTKQPTIAFAAEAERVIIAPLRISLKQT